MALAHGVKTMAESFLVLIQAAYHVRFLTEERNARFANPSHRHLPAQDLNNPFKTLDIFLLIRGSGKKSLEQLSVEEGKREVRNVEL